MFNFLKKKSETKPTIIALHGFGRRRTIYFSQFRIYFETLGYKFINPELYNINDSSDCNPEDWIMRAETAIRDCFKNNEEVILLGFSMGGVIASSLAAKMPIKKLILIAPAFNYININTALDIVSKLVDPSKEDNEPYPLLPESFSQTFRTIVDTLKDDITLVKCPILIFHGTDDKVILFSSSEKVMKKIGPIQHTLVLLYGANHDIFKQPMHNRLMQESILSFINDKIF